MHAKTLRQPSCLVARRTHCLRSFSAGRLSRNLAWFYEKFVLVDPNDLWQTCMITWAKIVWLQTGLAVLGPLKKGGWSNLLR